MSTSPRTIIRIDSGKCTGCGICVDSCHEGAIQIRDGKAVLIADSYCDGLGDCLAPCPAGAIALVTRDADPYDAEAVKKHIAAGHPSATPLPCGCPGSAARALRKPSSVPADPDCRADARSELVNWPVQLNLVPPAAPYFRDADILLAADCAAAASPDFHARHLCGRPLVIACPKLEDNGPQIEKLARIVSGGMPSGITVLRMEVPCCGGLVRVAKEAARRSGRNIPVKAITIGADGKEVS